MAIVDKLLALGARVPSRQLRVDYTLFRPSRAETAGAAPTPLKPSPLVSCMMVTKGDRFSVRFALACFQGQTYPAKELVVIVDAGATTQVEALVGEMRIEGVRIHAAPAGLTLGELRNLAIEWSRGDILMQWDDDDLYDPLRITSCVNLLSQLPGAAVLMARLLLWWPGRRLAALSGQRLWEGTIAMRREYAPTYPSLSRAEDTPGVDAIVRSQPVVVADAPLLYVYAITQNNTWHIQHFNEIMATAEYVIGGAEYDDLLQALSARLPILAYDEAVRRLASA